jgi:EpsI family protein
MSFLNSKFTRLVTMILLVQCGAYYAIAMRSEIAPVVEPLSTFPQRMGDWKMLSDTPIEEEVQRVLKADDTMNRMYDGPGGKSAYLFIAFFKSQRNGQAPHSPKNCLPGAGWQAVEDTKIAVTVPDWPTRIIINKYVVERGNDKSVTLYWYQSHNRVIASEYKAKFWLVADAIRYRRSDTAIVKIVLPATSTTEEQATATGISFIQTIFPHVVKQIPL